MIEVIGFIAVMLGLPFALALFMKGSAWYRARQDGTLEAAAATVLPDQGTDPRAFPLQSDATRPEGSRPPGAVSPSAWVRDRSSRVSARAMFREPYSYSLRNADAGRRAANRRSNGFAHVQLRLSDGLGHHFTVERRLCLN